METLAMLIWINLLRHIPPLYVNESQLCPWRTILSGLNSSSFLCVHGYSSSRCPPLQEAARHMREAYRQPHSHTNTQTPRTTSGRGTSADLLRKKTAWAVEQLCVVSTKRRVKYCWVEGQSVCWGRKERGRERGRERRMFFGNHNVPSAHCGVYERHWTTAVRNYCIVIKWLLPHWQPY